MNYLNYKKLNQVPNEKLIIDNEINVADASSSHPPQGLGGGMQDLPGGNILEALFKLVAKPGCWEIGFRQMSLNV